MVLGESIRYVFFCIFNFSFNVAGDKLLNKLPFVEIIKNYIEQINVIGFTFLVRISLSLKKKNNGDSIRDVCFANFFPHGKYSFSKGLASG